MNIFTPPYDVSYHFDANLRDVPNAPNEMQRALEWLQMRLDECPLDATRDRVELGGLLGVYTRTLNQCERAIAALHEALQLCHPLNDSRLEVKLTIRLAHALQWDGQYAEADAHFAQTITRCEADTSLANYLDFALQHAGKSKFDQGDYAVALNFFEQALALRQKRGNVELIESSQLAAYTTRQRLNQY